MTTLYEFLNYCSKTISIYEGIAEDNGTSGDVETFEFYMSEAEELKKCIERLKNDFETNKLVSVSGIYAWLEELEITDKRIIQESLKNLKEKRENQIQQLQNDIEYCNLFLKEESKI